MISALGCKEKTRWMVGRAGRCVEQRGALAPRRVGPLTNVNGGPRRQLRVKPEFCCALPCRENHRLGGGSRRFVASCAARGCLSCSMPGPSWRCFGLCVPGFHFCPYFTTQRFCFQPKLQIVPLLSEVQRKQHTSFSGLVPGLLQLVSTMLLERWLREVS